MKEPPPPPWKNTATRYAAPHGHTRSLNDTFFSTNVPVASRRSDASDSSAPPSAPAAAPTPPASVFPASAIASTRCLYTMGTAMLSTRTAASVSRQPTMCSCGVWSVGCKQGRNGAGWRCVEHAQPRQRQRAQNHVQLRGVVSEAWHEGHKEGRASSPFAASTPLKKGKGVGQSIHVPSPKGEPEGATPNSKEC
eukprot:352761-Chlamydomonas_euryale.AAC.2